MRALKNRGWTAAQCSVVPRIPGGPAGPSSRARTLLVLSGFVIPENKDAAAELAIRHLAASYTDAVNRMSPEDAAEVWMPDGELTFFGSPLSGRDAIFEGYRTTFGSFTLLFQMTHTGLVVVKGDRARARWWISEIDQKPGADYYGTFFGLYQDEVVRTDAGWRFARRQLDEIRSGRLQMTARDPRSAPDFWDLGLPFGSVDR